MSLRQGQGTIAFRANHPHTDWPTNTACYKFGATPVSEDGVFVTASKYPDGSLEVIVMDQTTANATFREAIPTLDAKGLHIVVTWKDGTVSLYLQGQPVRTIVLKTSP
jgi:hypothetical protein